MTTPSGTTSVDNEVAAKARRTSFMVKRWS